MQCGDDVSTISEQKNDDVSSTTNCWWVVWYVSSCGINRNSIDYPPEFTMKCICWVFEVGHGTFDVAPKELLFPTLLVQNRCDLPGKPEFGLWMEWFQSGVWGVWWSRSQCWRGHSIELEVELIIAGNRWTKPPAVAGFDRQNLQLWIGRPEGERSSRGSTRAHYPDAVKTPPTLTIQRCPRTSRTSNGAVQNHFPLERFGRWGKEGDSRLPLGRKMGRS